MQRSFKFTKLKLITGYILILLLGAIAIVFIYKQTIALTQKGNDEIAAQTIGPMMETTTICFV